MIDQPDHPAIARLRVELDAAWKGMRTLDQVDDDLRDRIVAELRAAVPDVAGRAAREAEHEAVVAEIRRFADDDGRVRRVDLHHLGRDRRHRVRRRDGRRRLH